MKQININILGLSEMRWTSAGQIASDRHLVIYSGGQHHERGVGFILDEFCAKALKGYWAISDRVTMIKLQAKPFDINIIQVYAPTSSFSNELLGDFYEDIEEGNEATVSHRRIPSSKVISMPKWEKEGLRTLLDLMAWEPGMRVENIWLIEWSKQHGMVIANTWFKVPVRRKWTWKSPHSNTRNQIDYILIRERFRNALKPCKAYSGADCGSDHNPVIAKVQLKLRKLKQRKQNKKLDIQQLKLNEEIRMKHNVEVSKRLQALAEVEDLDEKWKIMKESITTAAEKTIPVVERKTKQKWTTEDILEKMDDRRKSKGNSIRYAELVKEIRAVCEQAKEDWLNKECEELERVLIRRRCTRK